MKSFLEWLDDSWPGLVLVVILLTVIGGLIWLAVSNIRTMNALQRDCITAGYENKEYLETLNRWTCLDVREGGVYELVPIEQVRAELDGR